MRTLNRLALTLQRIEEFLAIVRIEDFGSDVEGGKRVIDDLHFLHEELKAGRKTLPFPENERRPLDVAYGHDGHFTKPFTELHDRTVDLFGLFQAKTWPSLIWQAEPFQGPIPDEPGLWALYEQLVTALREKNIDDLMTLLDPGMRSTSDAAGASPAFLPSGERRRLTSIMQDMDYEVETTIGESVRLQRMFDSRRLRLLRPDQEEYALGVNPFGKSRRFYPLKCQFGRIDESWAVVGYD